MHLVGCSLGVSVLGRLEYLVTLCFLFVFFFSDKKMKLGRFFFVFTSLFLQKKRKWKRIPSQSKIDLSEFMHNTFFRYNMKESFPCIYVLYFDENNSFFSIFGCFSLSRFLFGGDIGCTKFLWEGITLKKRITKCSIYIYGSKLFFWIFCRRGLPCRLVHRGLITYVYNYQQKQ